VKRKWWSKFWAVALSVAMTVTMLPDVTQKKVSAAEGTDAVAPTEITSGTGEDLRTWQLDWNDEFNGSSLDTSKWSYMVGTGAGYSGDGWGNNELEYYTNGENASVANGNLTITAKKLADDQKAAYSGKSYTSTRLWTMDDGNNPGGSKTTKYSKTYGRIEARIKITSDATDGNSTGLWPAFWMMPADDVYGTWAASGELDIMETRGRTPGKVEGTIHYGNTWPNNKSNGGAYEPSNGFTTADYHTYAVEWLPGEIRWYMDDQLYYTTKNWFSSSANNATDYTYPAPFDQNFYVLLNLAVGGNFDGGALSDSWNNAWMDVDYVRVYDLVDPDTSTIADYTAMEAAAVKPVETADDHLVSGEIGVTNYVDSSLANIIKTTNYPSETAKEWYLSELLGGAATASMDADALKVNVTAPGSQNYSVQLIHNVPLTKGYRYVLTFDAKADAAKSIGAKYGNIGGYPAYSDNYSVDLTADWKNYTYTFDMTNTTDATGRIEFNLGLTSGACYFKNFSVICTGLIPTEGPDDAKAPLANGNHIYNGTFDQGTGRSFYWHTGEGTNMSVDKATCDLEVVGTSENSNVYQKGMNLLGGDSYHVALDAKALTPGDITVKLVSKDGLTTYKLQTLTIGSNYTAQPYAFDFVMGADVTDSEGIFEVVTGNNTVYLDNITMTRTSNNNMDWSKVDFWPMYNGDFFNGDDGWNIWSEGAGFQSHTVTDGVLSMTTNIGSNPNFWCVGMQSPSMSFAANVPYKFTVHLNGSKDKTIKIETPDGVQKDYNFVAGDNTVSIEYKPSEDKSGKFSMYLGIGEGPYTFTVDSIDVEVDSSKIAIPEGHAKPASIASAGNVKAGNDIVLKYSDNVWASKITTTYVGGTEIDPAAVTVNSNGTLTIASSAMPAAGNYSVKFDAEGYSQTKAITQTVLESSGNLITNGTFDINTDGWTVWFNGTGAGSVQDGKVVYNVTGSAGNSWDGQLKQTVKVEANPYYILQFDASSTVDRPIQLEFKQGVAAPVINLTNVSDTYYVVLNNVTPENTEYVLFMTGNVNNCLADFGAVGNHSITFDNIKLYPATKEQVDALSNPTITLSDSVVVGNDIVLHYTENSAWEAKTITVSVNGNDITAAIDKTANTITINKADITLAGNYDIVIKAEGYKAITTSVKVLSSKGENLFVGEWFTWTEPGLEQGSITANENGFNVDFVSTVITSWNAPEFWSIQAKKSGITTFAGKEYKLSFDAELIYDDPAVTENRDMVIELGAQAVQPAMHLEPGKHTYTYLYTPGARSDFYILFMPGGNAADVKPHTLNITNIKFAENINIPALAAPTNVSAVKQSANSISVTWDTVANAASYHVYRSNTADGNYTYLGLADTNSYSDATLTAGTYYYKVTAVPADGSLEFSESEYSLASLGVIIAEVPVAVTGVTLNRQTLTMSVSGSAITLQVTILPDNAANKNVTWSSSDTSVATVENGTVVPVGIGTTTITVTSQDGGFEDSCIVTVEENPSPIEADIESITASNGTVSIVLDRVPDEEPVIGDFTMTASINGGTAEALSPTDFNWNEANKTVTISFAQIAKTSSIQNVTVAVTYHLITAESSFTVQAETPAVIPVSSITVNSYSPEVVRGGFLQMYAAVLPAAATDSSVIWSVTNSTGIASISADGLLAAIQGGYVTVKATAKDGSGVFGTKVVYIYTPSDNTTNPSTGGNTTTPSTPGKIEIELKQEDIKGGELILPVTAESLKEDLTNPDLSKLTVSVTVPDNTTKDTPEFSLEAEVLEAVKESGKDLTVDIQNALGRILYSWTFDNKHLNSANQEIAKVNVSLNRHIIEAAEKNLISGNLGEGFVFSFNQEGVFPSQAGVRIYVGDLAELTDVTKIYLYHYNKDTGKLETLPYSSKYVIDSEGYVNINVLYGSDYVALLEKPAASNITSMSNQISVAPAATTLSLKNSKKKSTQIAIDLPPTLEIVKSRSDVTSQSAIGRVSVTYSSSNTKIATVDKDGNITAVGKGTVVITTVIKIYNGSKKVVKTEITVK
jgi:beta-glucanase (GH16 family)/uncharacterized protein YjdB